MEHRSTVSLTLTVDSRSDLTELRAEMRSWIGQRAGDREVDDIVLACGEAVDNALEHGIAARHRGVGLGRRPAHDRRAGRGHLACVGAGAAARARATDHDGADGQRLGRYDRRDGDSPVPSLLTEARREASWSDRVSPTVLVRRRQRTPPGRCRSRSVRHHRRCWSRCRHSLDSSASPDSSPPALPTSSASASIASTMSASRSARPVGSPCRWAPVKFR